MPRKKKEIIYPENASEYERMLIDAFHARNKRKRVADRIELPPKPPCGSIEINRMIRAINNNEPNPCTHNQECIDEWNLLMKCKENNPDAYYSCIEPDFYECVLQQALI
jgi:hypothetical protein